MIAKLTGILDAAGEDGAVIDVGGVGYLVFCSSRTLAALPAAGEVTALLVETHVREDHIHLYGFATAAERRWFRLLTTVQGVGARVALAILSALAPDELALAIAADDVPSLMRANGVGRRMAQRVVGELKDKAGALALGPAAAAADQPPAGAAVVNGASADAVSALVNLGYRRVEAMGAIGQVARRLGPDATAEALIKAGLQELGT